MSRLISENDKVPVLLTKRQIELLNEHTFAEDDLLNVLHACDITGGKSKVLFTLHGLEDLNSHVAAAANHCSNKKLQQKLDSLFEVIQEVESKYDLH